MHPRSARIRPTSVASQHVCGCLRLDAYPNKISQPWLAQFVQTPVKNDDVKDQIARERSYVTTGQHVPKNKPCFLEVKVG